MAARAVAPATERRRLGGQAGLPAAMDDVRVQWLGERLQRGLGQANPAAFEELLNRNDGEETERLLHFLNMSASAEDSQPAGLFFRQELRLDEIDVEIGAPRPHATGS